MAAADGPLGHAAAPVRGREVIPLWARTFGGCAGTLVRGDAIVHLVKSWQTTSREAA